MYDDAIKLLTSQGKFHIELGLERISSILDLLGNPQDNLQYIHVAGTNGKGSVCAILSTILTCAGKKVGLYTSPHIFEYTERIQINGVEIPKKVFSENVFEVSNLADKNGIHLTEFEILTAVMFKYFSDEKVDVVVLEVGLGGRFDATNVIKQNLCSIITHIDFDHTDRLGNTLSKIAFEKAGIIKQNCPVITSEGYEVVKDIADEKNSLFVLVSPFEDIENLSLKGTYQQENLSLALFAVRKLFPDIAENTIQTALTRVKHPYRFQVEGNIVVDGAHNPNGILALKDSLEFYFPSTKKRYIFGCLKNKDYKKMISNLFERGDEIYFYHFDNPNSLTYTDFKGVCQYPSKEFHPNMKFDDNVLTVICGSFYMLKDFADFLRQ